MAKIFKCYREESRIDWGCNEEKLIPLSDNQIMLGCVLRIADSLETIAKSKYELEAKMRQIQNSRDYYRKLDKEGRREIDHLHSRISVLKGVITRMKRRINHG